MIKKGKTYRILTTDEYYLEEFFTEKAIKFKILEIKDRDEYDDTVQTQVKITNKDNITIILNHWWIYEKHEGIYFKEMQRNYPIETITLNEWKDNTDKKIINSGIYYNIKIEKNLIAVYIEKEYLEYLEELGKLKLRELAIDHIIITGNIHIIYLKKEHKKAIRRIQEILEKGEGIFLKACNKRNIEDEQIDYINEQLTQELKEEYYSDFL